MSFNIVAETKYQSLDKEGEGLADPSVTSAKARKRAVLKVLGDKTFRPLEWAAAQKECREKVGPMRIVRKTTYRAHENGKTIAKARDTKAEARADIATAIDKAPKADKTPPRSSDVARSLKKEGVA